MEVSFYLKLNKFFPERFWRYFRIVKLLNHFFYTIFLSFYLTILLDFVTLFSTSVSFLSYLKCYCIKFLHSFNSLFTLSVIQVGSLVLSIFIY